MIISICLGIVAVTFLIAHNIGYNNGRKDADEYFFWQGYNQGYNAGFNKGYNAGWFGNKPIA